MELIRFGLDTVRLRHDLRNPLPLQDEGYRVALAAHWAVSVKLQNDPTAGLYESRTAAWQDEENSTIRAFVMNAGRSIVTEFSVPRVISDSPLNTHLSSHPEMLDATATVLSRLRQVTPSLGLLDPPAYRRLDLAADIAAGSARPGLIAAAGQFLIPGARKITRSIFPGETGRVSSSQVTFRGYDKARELVNKTAAVLRDLEESERRTVLETMAAYKASGAVRLELALTPKKQQLTGDDAMKGNIKWAEAMRTGFYGGVMTIGGLDYIRREVDGRADLSTQTRNTLIAFAVRYAELGEDGMLAVMASRTFYRNKKRFLDSGLRLDDLTTYSGEMDLRPVINEVEAI